MRTKLGLAIAGLLLAASPTWAHHSGAMFDRTKTVTLVGEIKEYIFENPHVWIEMMVDQGGKKVQWSVEGEGPRAMIRMGLTPATLKPGHKVTLHAHPLRDGRTGGSFMDVTLPDGTVLVAGRPASAPAQAAAAAKAAAAPAPAPKAGN